MTAAQMVPFITLPAADGGSLRLSAFRGRANLALYLLPGGDTPEGRAVLGAIAGGQADFQERHTQPMAVIDAPLAVAEALHRSLALSFPLLADPAGRVAQALANAPLATIPASPGPIATDQPRVILADRYGEIRVHQVGWAALHAANQADLLEWLTYIDCLCSC